jgi:hypothetical protein
VKSGVSAAIERLEGNLNKWKKAVVMYDTDAPCTPCHFYFLREGATLVLDNGKALQMLLISSS